MPRKNPRLLAAVAAAALLSAGVVAVSATAAEEDPQAANPKAVPTSPIGIQGRGAQVPFHEVEAEAAQTDGTVIGPDRTYGALPSEASGRQAVTLDAVGEYVEFTLPADANAMVLRYSLPDNEAGTGRNASVALEADGRELNDLGLTSRYSWYYGSYPFTNTPGADPHHFYSEARTHFGATLDAGTKVRVKVTSLDESSSFTVDLADFELVAEPGEAPAGALNVVTGYGADNTGKTDATQAIQKALYDGAAQGKPVWLPRGDFKVTDHLIVDGVELAGAGPWHSVLTGPGVGVFGKYTADGGPSRNVTLRDFAIIGDVTDRDDNEPSNAIGGAMSDSLVDNLWIQHTKVGAWMSGPMDNFTIANSRIIDQTADGVNFHGGVTHSTVKNTFVRNTGDDGLAMWAQKHDNAGNSFVGNTVVAPVLANNIAIYGGQDMTVSGNVVADTVTNGGGIHVGNRYPDVRGETAVQGRFEISDNTLLRAGNSDYNWKFGIGAIWFDGLNEPVQGAQIRVSNTDIIDSSYSAVQFIEGGVSGVSLENVSIDGTGTFALQLQTGGSASLKNVTATSLGAPEPIYECQNGFELTDAGGNSGWNTGTAFCGEWPAAVTPASPR